MRFYLKVIEPNLTKIVVDGYRGVSLQSLPWFETHIGLHLEYLLLQNRGLILSAIGLNPLDVLAEGPFRQNKNISQGCQIDYLLQTTTQNLFVCEFKFRRRELGNER